MNLYHIPNNNYTISNKAMKMLKFSKIAVPEYYVLSTFYNFITYNTINNINSNVFNSTLRKFSNISDI